MEEEKDKYWFCIIGPAKRSEIPFGGDLPMRMTAKKEFKRIIGREARVCSSGWGISEEDYIRMIKVKNEIKHQ
jgi:hypothetical protein